MPVTFVGGQETGAVPPGNVTVAPLISIADVVGVVLGGAGEGPIGPEQALTTTTTKHRAHLISLDIGP
jgi:hypothetical protein